MRTTKRVNLNSLVPKLDFVKFIFRSIIEINLTNENIILAKNLIIGLPGRKNVNKNNLLCYRS